MAAVVFILYRLTPIERLTIMHIKRSQPMLWETEQKIRWQKLRYISLQQLKSHLAFTSFCTETKSLTQQASCEYLALVLIVEILGPDAVSNIAVRSHGKCVSFTFSEGQDRVPWLQSLREERSIIQILDVDLFLWQISPTTFMTMLFSTHIPAPATPAPNTHTPEI